jgi:hypothetical protein
VKDDATDVKRKKDQWTSDNLCMRASRACLAAAILAIPIATGAQQQAPNTRSGWPCGGRLDPSYFRVAEETGGQLLLLAPEEVGDSARLLTAFGSHLQTIFRLAGTVPPGVHEFQVAIDPSVESALFSISVQCLQTAEVLRPSGAFAAGDAVTDLSHFRAERMVIVSRPEPGMWTIRVAGNGLAGLVVQAKSALALTHVEFAPTRTEAFTRVPTAGVENTVRLRVSGHPAEIHGSIVSGTLARIAQLPLAASDADGAYESRFIPPAEGFRVLVSGRDSEGALFTRLTAALFTAR